MTIRRVLLFVLALCRFRPVPRIGQHRREPSSAPGIFLFTTPSYGDVGLDGNSIAILSHDGVLVFDTNGTPAAAAAVLAEIRTLTTSRCATSSTRTGTGITGTAPRSTQRAFPDVHIVAHEKTRAMMMGPALEFNRPGLETQLPGYLADRSRSAWPTADAASSTAGCSTRTASSSSRRRRVHHTFPNVTFSDRLTIELGERHDPGAALRPRRHAGRRVPVSAGGEDPASPAICSSTRSRSR